MGKENRTISDLLDNLDSEFSWRRKELVVIKSRIKNGDCHAQQSVMIRSGITMLYAHWEGFVKNAATFYLNFVSLRRLNHKELHPSFFALCVKKKLISLENMKSSNKHAEAIEFIIQEYGKRSNVPYRNVVNTRSNLSSKVFKEICFLIGLEYAKYTTKEKMIDKEILEKRNGIAHGQWLDIDYDRYMEVHEKMISLMESIKDEVFDLASQEQFKRTRS